MVEAVDIKKFVNEILGKKGIPPVKNFAKEFADGSNINSILNANLNVVLFQTLFNILFDERVNCRLEKSNIVEQRVLNWNKINGKLLIMKLMSSSFDLL